MPSISWLRSPGLRGARTGIHSRFRRRCSPALSHSRARCSASRSLARFYLLSCLPISFLSSYFFPTVVAAAARRNGRDFLTASHALRPFRCCFIPAAGCSGAGLSSCLQPILLCRTSWAHSRRRGSDSCRLRLIQPQRGCARFGSNCRLGASPSFLIRATRAQIVDRQIGRDRGVPISPHIRSSSGRRYAGPRPRPIIDARILSKFGSDTEDMEAIEAAPPIAAVRMLWCMLGTGKTTIAARFQAAALIARAAREPRSSR